MAADTVASEVCTHLDCVTYVNLRRLSWPCHLRVTMYSTYSYINVRCAYVVELRR